VLIRAAVISIDAATFETYAVNRRGGDFTRLLERLAFISELQANGPLERLTIHMTVQANNYREMGDFVEMGRRHNCDEVAFHQILDWETFSPAEFAEKSGPIPKSP